IAAPNLPVPACQYRSKEITLVSGTYSYFTLGNDYVMPRTPDTQYYRQPDLTLCTGASLQLAATAGFAGYLWDDGSTDSMRTITAAGTYHLLSLDACDPRMDTFVVVEQQQDSVSRRI